MTLRRHRYKSLLDNLSDQRYYHNYNFIKCAPKIHHNRRQNFTSPFLFASAASGPKEALVCLSSIAGPIQNSKGLDWIFEEASRSAIPNSQAGGQLAGTVRGAVPNLGWMIDNCMIKA